MTTPLDFPSGVANVHFTGRPTYHLQTSRGITATVIRAAHCPSGAGAGFKIIRLLMIPTNWAHRNKRDGLQTHRTAIKQALPFHGLIILRLRIGDLDTRVWFGIAPQIAVGILLGTAFIDPLILGVFRLEQKVVPWHSKPAAIRPSQKQQIPQG